MPRPVCAIFGAGEGLGKALAAKFSAEGCDMALVSRTEKGSEAAAEAARAANGDVRSVFFCADATQPETIESAFGEIVRELGPVDILIYNARGTFPACEPMDMTYDAMDDVFRVEVMGAFAAAKSVIPAMRERGKGTLLFSSATAALRGSARYPLYAIGKFGLRALTQSLAKAYAKDGLHVAHIRLDCDLDVPIMRELYGDRYDPEALASPNDVAETYWWVHKQPKGAWSNEVELRPHTETWTC
jgi:NAD(P)-dependent dehydrogenase (short-subunit alcohol dehydrogenase family)